MINGASRQVVVSPKTSNNRDTPGFHLNNSAEELKFCIVSEEFSKWEYENSISSEKLVQSEIVKIPKVDFYSLWANNPSALEYRASKKIYNEQWGKKLIGAIHVSRHSIYPNVLIKKINTTASKCNCHLKGSIFVFISHIRLHNLNHRTCKL